MFKLCIKYDLKRAQFPTHHITQMTNLSPVNGLLSRHWSGVVWSGFQFRALAGFLFAHVANPCQWALQQSISIYRTYPHIARLGPAYPSLSPWPKRKIKPKKEPFAVAVLVYELMLIFVVTLSHTSPYYNASRHVTSVRHNVAAMY